MTLPTYDGYFDAWLDRAIPGIEELARSFDVPRCEWCGGSGMQPGADRMCEPCEGTGIAIELGVAG